MPLSYLAHSRAFRSKLHPERVAPMAVGVPRHPAKRQPFRKRLSMREPRRRRVPAAQGNRRREAQPQGGRRGRTRRGRRGLPAGPGAPGVRRRGRLEERIDRGRGFKVALPLLRQEVHLPHRHRPRTLPKAAPRLDLLHQAHAPNVPVECATELCGVTHKTAFDWRHRVLATISGYFDRYVYLFRVNQARRMRFGCKGGAPYPDGRRDRRDLPQLR